MFQEDFARAFERADETVIAPVFRSNLSESERLSADQLIEDGAGRVVGVRGFDGSERRGRFVLDASGRRAKTDGRLRGFRFRTAFSFPRFYLQYHATS